MVRKRLKLKLRIRALTAEGRMQALALGILPVATFFGLTLFRPEYMQPLWDRPQLLLALAAMQLTGTIWVRRIVQLEF
jgi:tight adherence protein B